MEQRRLPDQPETTTPGLNRAFLKSEIAAGQTIAGIAGRAGVSARSVTAALQRLGVPAPTAARRYPQLHDRVWLQAQIDSGLTPRQIAAVLGCSYTAVDRAIKLRATLKPPATTVMTAAWLNERFDAGHSVDEIAAEIGCSRSSVLTACARHGISRRGRDPLLDDREFLERRINAGMTSREIAAEIGCSQNELNTAWMRHASLIARRS